MCLQSLSPFDLFLLTVPQSPVAQVVPIDNKTNNLSDYGAKNQLWKFHSDKHEISFNKYKKWGNLWLMLMMDEPMADKSVNHLYTAQL